MELDYKTVKALASPTRIEILKNVKDKGTTPTDLSDEIGKTKSTVSTHLSKLDEAGLVEKDEEDGRRRVVYSATDKTEAILQGKSRKVKFSVLSTVSTAWLAAAAFLGAGNLSRESGKMESLALAQGADIAAETADAAGSSLSLPELVLIGGGVFLTLASLAALLYGLMVWRLDA